MTTSLESASGATLYTYKQAGAILQVTDRTVYNLVRQGELPAVRFGRNVRIDRRDLEQFIEACKSSIPA